MWIRRSMNRGDEAIPAFGLMYRGAVTESNKAKAVTEANNILKFADWCPQSSKVIVNSSLPVCGSQPPSDDVTYVPALRQCMASFLNSTSLHRIFATVNKKMHTLIDTKAFFHLYTSEGMTEDVLTESWENLLGLEKDYAPCPCCECITEDDEDG